MLTRLEGQWWGAAPDGCGCACGRGIAAGLEGAGALLVWSFCRGFLYSTRKDAARGEAGGGPQSVPVPVRSMKMYSVQVFAKDSCYIFSMHRIRCV